MIKFSCQLDWVIACPDIWLKLILGMSVNVFLGVVNLCFGRLNKADYPSWCGQASSNPRKA